MTHGGITRKEILEMDWLEYNALVDKLVERNKKNKTITNESQKRRA